MKRSNLVKSLVCFIGLSLSGYAAAEGPVVKAFQVKTKTVKPSKNEVLKVNVSLAGKPNYVQVDFVSPSGLHQVLEGELHRKASKVKQSLFSFRLPLSLPSEAYTLSHIMACSTKRCNRYEAADLLNDGVFSEIPTFNIVNPATLTNFPVPSFNSFFFQQDIAYHATNAVLPLEVNINYNRPYVFNLSVTVCNQNGDCIDNNFSQVPTNQNVVLDFYRRGQSKPESKWTEGEWAITQVTLVDDNIGVQHWTPFGNTALGIKDLFTIVGGDNTFQVSDR